MSDLRSPAILELTQRGADQLQHAGGRSLLDHLIGTSELVQSWTGDAELAAAAMYHSAYATQFFPYALFERSERGRVEQVVGERAERLAFAFCAIDRNAFVREFATWRPQPGQQLDVSSHHGQGVVSLTIEDASALAILECANVVDQDCGPTCGPGVRAAVVVGELAESLRRLRPQLQLRWLSRAQLPVSVAHANAAAVAYETALPLLHDDSDRAQRLLLECSRLIPTVGEPLLLSAGVHLRRGGHDVVHRLATDGAVLLTERASAWDKRRTVSAWLDYADRLCAVSGLQKGNQP